MKNKNRQFVKQGGSALILVVVVTVLLALSVLHALAIGIINLARRA